MAAYRRVYDSRHLQADCQDPGSAPKPYARQSSMGYLFYYHVRSNYASHSIARQLSLASRVSDACSAAHQRGAYMCERHFIWRERHFTLRCSRCRSFLSTSLSHNFSGGRVVCMSAYCQGGTTARSCAKRRRSCRVPPSARPSTRSWPSPSTGLYPTWYGVVW